MLGKNLISLIDSRLVVLRDVNVFIFQKNGRFVMKTTTKNRKQNDRFKNDSFFKFVVSLTIVNDDPLLTIVNDGPLLTTTFVHDR